MIPSLKIYLIKPAMPSRLFLAALLSLMACFVVHSPATFAADPAADRMIFEHMDTGFPLRGAHEHLTCEQCHVRGIFKGTPRRCMGCHLQSTDIEASKKPPEHIPTTQDCDVCHDASKPNVSWQLVRINHAGLSGECAHCHNNVFVPGQPAGHVRTQPRQACDDCHHSTATWANAKFDHTGISTNCVQCHNNVQAIGKPQLHVPIANTVSCEICHGTRFISFANARMDHAGANIVNNCQTCHQTEQYLGVIHVRPIVKHPSAPLDCANCHCTSTFDRQICQR